MKTLSDERDVVVVGGGPAGCACATYLAQAGLDVLLLDRAHFPRDKPCGEFLTPEAARLLRSLGVWQAVWKAGAVRIPVVRLWSPSGAFAQYSPEEEEAAGWSLRRTALDAALLENARAHGVQVREGVAVRGLVWEGARVAGVICKDGREISARLVVGADGTHSLIARQLGWVRPIPRLQRVALVSHWRGVKDLLGIEMRAQGKTVCGFSPVAPDEANLTLVVPTSYAACIAGRAREFLEEHLHAQFPNLAERLVGAEREETVRAVGCFGHVTRRASADGVLLVGDAATFIDPFTGEGVYFALRGAELAAEVAIDALRAGDVSATRLAAYDHARRELGQRYLLCGLVQAVVRTPWLMNRAIRRMADVPPLTDRLMRVLGDVRPPTEALNVGFLWRLFAPGSF